MQIFVGYSCHTCSASYQSMIAHFSATTGSLVRAGSVSSVIHVQVLCRVSIQPRRVVPTAACSTSPESSARSVHVVKPAGMTAIAMWISIINPNIIIPGRPTYIDLIFWGCITLACLANVVVSTSIAVGICISSPPTLRWIAAFEAEGCSG